MIDPVKMDWMIFGGSFDPPHAGHLQMASYVLDHGLTLCLSFVPAAVSPFKVDDPPSSPEDRLKMLHMGIAQLLSHYSSERLNVLEMEVKRPPPSYTYETCETLRREHPDLRIGLLLGSDSFPHLHKWKRSEEILLHHPLVVFMRPGDDRNRILDYAEEQKAALSSHQVEIIVLDNPRVDCSSTELKAALQRASSRNLVGNDCIPESVLNYIHRNHLYQ